MTGSLTEMSAICATPTDRGKPTHSHVVCAIPRVMGKQIHSYVVCADSPKPAIVETMALKQMITIGQNIRIKYAALFNLYEGKSVAWSMVIQMPGESRTVLTTGRNKEDIGVCEERLCLLKGLPVDRLRESHQLLLQSRKHRMTK